MNEPLFLDAAIIPRRSLSETGRAKIIGVFAAINLMSGLIFFKLGASFIILFLGAVVGALYAALAISARPPLQREHIRICVRHVRVTRRARGRDQVLWESPTAFTRVSLVDDDFGAGALWLRLSAKEIRIAEHLSRPERQALARQVEAAIVQARKWRFDPGP
jgi:uncharacterized membrane protein